MVGASVAGLAAPLTARQVLAVNLVTDALPPVAIAVRAWVVSQLGQTLDLGWAEGRLTPSVAGAVFGSLAVMAATLTFPPLRGFLGLAAPGPGGVLPIAGATATSVALGRVLPRAGDQEGELPPAQAALSAAAGVESRRA